VDLQAILTSKVGASLFIMAKKAAMDEIGKSVNSQELTSEKIKEVLGMDPFEEIQGGRDLRFRIRKPGEVAARYDST